MIEEPDDCPFDISMDFDDLYDKAMTLWEHNSDWTIEREIMKRDMDKYRQRLERRDNQIRRMVECLRTIAGDDCITCLHDAMAEDALKGYRRTISPVGTRKEERK